MLSATGLSAGYGPIRALRDVSIEVGAGECVAVIGANGAGKSTLLNTLSGVLRPTQGTITLDGQAIAGEPAWRIARRGLLQVPEGRQILPALTVEENLDLGCVARGDRPVASDPRERVHALFPLLAERARQLGGSLSGGQQQMLAIGRALMADPRVLLLDEPSLGLAPKVVAQVFAALRSLKRGGLTLLVVEQNARLALALSDRAYVLERGAVIAAGPSADLARDPRVVEHYLGVASRDAAPAIA